MVFGAHFESPVAGAEGFRQRRNAGAGAVAFGEALAPGAREEDASAGIVEEGRGDAAEGLRHEGATGDVVPAQIPHVALEDVPHLVGDRLAVQPTGFGVDPDRVHRSAGAVAALRGWIARA